MIAWVLLTTSLATASPRLVLAGDLPASSQEIGTQTAERMDDHLVYVGNVDLEVHPAARLSDLEPDLLEADWDLWTWVVLAPGVKPGDRAWQQKVEAARELMTHTEADVAFLGGWA